MGTLGFPSYLPLGWMNWAPILGMRQEPGRFTRPAYKSSLNPASWIWGVGMRAYFLNPINCPPAFGYDERGQGLYHFLNRVRLPDELKSHLFLVHFSVCFSFKYE